jgi:chromosome segregation protein
VTAGKNYQVFLKSIQIQGFKSFADRLKIDLYPGLSVIVGPNGSGKSNVADAVRWVLGEQSAKSLRGTRMEDVIFAGSSARRPVGMAEVSLVFDNSTGLFALDYEEVVITRRVYRDGEGQFFINRSPCRLKDIQELFMDTGSGKEGFSIIGQGQVEEILNLKSEERRLLIEEVAGISKFRLRKKETLKKIEETKQNVSRLNDIISEVEARIEPLAKQAEAAKVSKELNANLTNTEIQLIVNELSEIGINLKKSQAGLEELKRELTVLTTMIAEEENLSIRSKYELNQLEQGIQALQGEVYVLENEAKEAAHELSLLSEKQGYAQDQLNRLEKEIKAAEEKSIQSKDKLLKLTEKEGLLKSSLQKNSQNLVKSEFHLTELQNLSGGTRLENLKTELFEELAQQTRIANEYAEIEQKKASLLRQKEQLLQDIATKEEEKSILLQGIHKLDEQRLEIESKSNLLRENMAKNNQQINNDKKRLFSLEKENAVLIRKIDQTSARLNALQTLEENLEGYQRGVREIILASRKSEINCSIYGTVADNIKVKAKHELAVETALGSALQNVIVETTKDGQECIAYLKKMNKGRATFLPLDALKGTRYLSETRTLVHKGFQGLAVELVRYDQRLNQIMESLLGKILVADNMDSAIELARMNNYRVRVVTLQGDQVNPGGSLTGGSTRSQSSGLLSRAREIEELFKLTNTWNSELEIENQKIALQKKELEEAFRLKEHLESELKGLNETKGILAVDRKYKEEEIDRLTESIRMLNFELTDTRAQLIGLGDRAIEKSRQIEFSEQKLRQLQTQQKDLERLVKETSIQIQGLTEEITSAKVEAARWEQELNQTKLLIAEEKELLQSHLALLEEKKNESGDFLQIGKELIQTQDEVEQRIQAITQQLNEKKYSLLERREKREKLSSETIKQEESVQNKNRRARNMEQQLHQSELRIARWEAEWKAGCSRLQEEYNLTWEEALTYLTQEDRVLLQERVVTLKQQIEKLGPVNYTALDEYPETLQRFEFLTTQKNDLLEAGDSLFQLIDELNNSMAERFEEGFGAVNQAFQEVFKELFNGGHAELFLDDPDNILETGVNIIAQPPGKKAQLLSLLSGGERSFTAIALLFAFLKVKPSPFCLLDEIEASLDEANAKRFIQYLRNLSDQTQFILISHRRTTMESADRLYGITMEESGVSKLLTVELEDRVS